MTTIEKKARVAFGGASGKQAKDHELPSLAVLLGTGEIELPAVFDPNVEGARALLHEFSQPGGFDVARSQGYEIPDHVAERFRSVRVYGSLDEMLTREEELTGEELGGLSCVFGSVPHHVHADAAIECLGRGLPYRGQKPMALSLEDCRRMLDAEEASGQVLGVCYQYADVVDWAVKQMDRIGRRGGAHLSHRRQDGIPDNELFWDTPDKGAVRDLGHVLSVAMRLSDSEPVWVEAEGSNDWGRRLYGDRFKAFDTVRGRIGYADETVDRIHLTWKDGGSPDEEFGVTEYGEDGEVEVPLIAKAMNPGAHRQVLRLYAGEGHTELGPSTGIYADGYVKADRNFLRAVGGGVELGFTARDAYNVERVSVGLTEAALSGRRMHLPA